MLPEDLEMAKQICSQDVSDCNFDCRNCTAQFELSKIIEMSEWKAVQCAKKSWDWFLKNADKFACINTDDNTVTFDYASAKENFLKYVKE